MTDASEWGVHVVGGRGSSPSVQNVIGYIAMCYWYY